MSTLTPEQFIENESLAKSFCEAESEENIPAVIVDPNGNEIFAVIVDPDGNKNLPDNVNPLLGECAKGEPLSEDIQETDVEEQNINNDDKPEGSTVDEQTINKIKSDIYILIERQQKKYLKRIEFLMQIYKIEQTPINKDIEKLLEINEYTKYTDDQVKQFAENVQRFIQNHVNSFVHKTFLLYFIEQSIIEEIQKFYPKFTMPIPDRNQNNLLYRIMYDFLFFNISITLYNITSNDKEYYKNMYYYFSAWDSPMLNNSFIIDEIFYLYLISLPMMITGDETNGFYMYKKFAEKPLPIPSDKFLSAIYVSIKDNNGEKDDNGENLVLFEFIGVKYKSVNEIIPNLMTSIVDNYRITSEFLTISFPQLSFLPATKNRFPIQTAITTIFNINGKNNIQNIIPHILKPENIDMFANMVLYYEESIILNNITRLGEDNLAFQCNSNEFYISDGEYVNFAKILDKKEIIEPISISFKNFKKYLENYIVNFCTPKFPSLKMVSFLKITYLNEFMIKNNWGYVDTAGGSLFNYIDNQSIVTADYDFKIYFYDVRDPKILEKREIYIKQWFINISHNLNEYMRSIKMLNTFEISGGFELFSGITFKIKLNSKRPFTSRGKEPELFPIPLYSDDLLLDMLICDSTNTCHKTTLKLNIGYFDLVFKRFSHSYLGELDSSFGNNLAIVNTNIRLIRQEGTTNGTPYPIPKETDIKGSFLVRTPTFYEIWEDVINLQNNPGFYLKRLTTGKDGKDKIRLIKLYNQFITIYKIFGLPGPFVFNDDNIIEVNENIKQWWSMLEQNDMKEQVIKAMIAYPMDNGLNVKFINNCYYQYNKTAQMAGSLQFTEIQERCFLSFRQKMTYDISQPLGYPFHFHPITWIYWSFIVWSKKYTEFKDGSDMKRIEIVKNIPRLLSEVDNPTTKKIIDKLSGYRKNLLETELVPEDFVFPDLDPSQLFIFILGIMNIFNPLIPVQGNPYPVPISLAAPFAGGYSKTKKNRKKPHSKPTRNKKSNLKSKSKTKSNKTKKNKKRRRKNNRSKK